MDDRIIENYNNFNTFKDFLSFLRLEHTPANTRYVTSVLKRHGIKHGFKSRFSVISSASRETLQSIVDSSSSFVDILKFFNLRNCGGNAKTLKTRIIELDIDTSNMLSNKRNKIVVRNQYVDYSEYISTVTSRKNIKNYILENRLIEYRCAECPNDGTHNNKPLTLQLDHIDGNNFNNSLDNLRFLCPNCHSQTETYCGRKNRKHKDATCICCGKVIKDTNKTRMCQVCNIQNGTYSEVAKRRYLNDNRVSITRIELENLISSHSLSSIGRMYNVSDNAVRKWCVKHNIDLKTNKFSKKHNTQLGDFNENQNQG